MSEWKKLTAEQVAWLEERAKAHGTSLIGAEFSMNNLETSGVWCEYMARSTKYHTPYWRMVKYGEPLKCLELQGFPMGEAVAAYVQGAQKAAEEKEKQDDNPWRVVQGSWSEPQGLTAKVHIEQAKAQAEAKWQKERRAAWVAFANTALNHILATPSIVREPEYKAAQQANRMLAMFDKRFGEDK